jgi:hypothetical protein
MTRRFLLHTALAAALSMSAACGGEAGPDPNEGNATLSGTVRTAAGSAALEGATISVGTVQATSDASGHFQLTGLAVGAATVRAERPGYLAATAAVTMSEGANAQDFSLAYQEIYETGTTAAYVPAGVGPVRGAIIVLGGPVSSGFVTGDPLGTSSPELEESLQALGASLRSLAKSARVALLGSETVNMANSSGSDNALFAALGTFAQRSGHPELADAPVLMFGVSAGSREAGGLVSRHPGRAIGLLLRVPAEAPALTAAEALAVPTFVMQAELDVAVNNPAIRAIFAANRSRGGRWALAVEPGIGHGAGTSLANQAVISWIIEALARIPAEPGPLVVFDEPSGWLGDPATLEIAPWADYPGDRAAASWHLSQNAALTWQALGAGES